MKFTCDAKALQDLIGIAESISNKKSTIFSDRYIKLKAASKKLEISTGTQEYFLTLFTNAQILEEGVTCAEDIANFVIELKDESKEISIFGDNSTLTIRRGRKKVGEMPAVPIANFADRSFTDKADYQFSISVKDLKVIIQACLSLDFETVKNAAIKQLHFATVLGTLTCFFGSNVSMFQAKIKPETKELNVSVPILYLDKIRKFISSDLLADDSTVEVSKVGSNIQFTSIIGTLITRTIELEYPFSSVIRMFDTSVWNTVNLSVAELAENFDAIEGLFCGYSDVMCTVKSQESVFYITNSVKNRKYEGMMDNPDSVDLEINLPAQALETACKFIKDKDAKFIIRRGNLGIQAVGIQSANKTFITVPVIKEKVAA